MAPIISSMNGMFEWNECVERRMCTARHVDEMVDTDLDVCPMMSRVLIWLRLAASKSEFLNASKSRGWC